VLNVIVLALNYNDQYSGYGSVLEIVNYCFSYFVVLELIIKLIAYKFTDFFQLPWNIFNLVVASLFLTDFVLVNTLSTYGGGFRFIPRIIRLARIIKLFKVIGRYYGRQSPKNPNFVSYRC
jgi:hypothetical protein